jgi:hypothetical protein
MNIGAIFVVESLMEFQEANILLKRIMKWNKN